MKAHLFFFVFLAALSSCSRPETPPPTTPVKPPTVEEAKN
jgi:hypothetical protein